MSRRFVFFLAVLLVQMFARLASADRAHDAVALKQHGDELLSQKSFVEALDAYEKSYALVPNPALHYNRGRALQFLARYPEALDAYERFEADASPELKARAPGLVELVAEIRSRVSTLRIACPLNGARVLVSGRDVGRTPLAPLRINAGRVGVEVLAEGYLPFRRDVDAIGGAVVDVMASPTSRQTSGVLVVRSLIPNTLVSVDGDEIGVVPAEATLTAGVPHPVVARHAGYSDVASQVVLAIGEHRDIFLNPGKRPALSSRWWFWTIVGVVVVGVAAGISYVLFTTERAADVGTIAPGTVRF